MSTYTTSHVPRVPHVSTERAILAAVAVAAVLATVSGARITWPAPAPPAPSVETAPAPGTDHASRVASAAAEAGSLREVARTVPGTAPVLADRIHLLELVTTGVLPVAAAEARVPAPATSAALQQRDPTGTSATIQARQELRALEELVRQSPGLATALAEDLATLEAITRGEVPAMTRSR